MKTNYKSHDVSSILAWSKRCQSNEMQRILKFCPYALCKTIQSMCATSKASIKSYSFALTTLNPGEGFPAGEDEEMSPAPDLVVRGV